MNKSYRSIFCPNGFGSKKIFQRIVLFALLIFSFNVKGQLVVTDNVSLATVIANLFGPGVTVTNVKIVGKPIQYGTFTATGTGLGINSGLLITNGSADSAAGANTSTATSSSESLSTCVGTNSTDACIATLTTTSQYDPCIITFDIVPSCDTLTMKYVFGSEEYPTYVGSTYNDAFGFFINGPKPGGGTYSCFNVATLPGGTIPVTINTVNSKTNNSYYVDNTVATAVTHNYVAYNGLTVPLTAYIPVTPCQSYSMEIAVADIGDCNLDSGVFLQYQGLQCAADQTLAVLPKNTTVCAGQPVVMTASGISGGGYTWSPATGLSSTTGTTVTATPTASIKYVVSAASACITEHDTVSITISGATTLTVTTTSTNNGCTPCSATGNVTSVTGGSGGPYSYLWLPGNLTTQAVTGLCTGNYTVVVHDNGINCPAPNDSIPIKVINTGGGLTFTLDSTASACTSSTGSASITMTSGTAPFTYTWSNGATSSNITGVGAGSYCVNIVDSKGCKDSACITVPNTGNVSSNITNVVNEPCFGDSSGSAIANVVGGTGPFNYAWNNGETVSTATVLKNGSYTVTITDANGCITTSTTKITQPTALQIKTLVVNTTCNAKCDGQLTVLPTGGTGPTYNYLWSNANTAASQINLCAGAYSVVVTDANGCTHDTTNLVITQPTAVQGTTTPTSADCGQADGSACVAATGGTGAYTYLWNTTPAQTTTCATNITAATYSVIIQDANKCPDTVTAIVTNLAGDTAEITASTNVTCNGSSNGTAIGGAKGGTAPYTYSWSTTPAQTNINATGLAAGNYTVTVKDNIGCISTATVTITQPAAVVLTPGPPQTICRGDSALLTASAVGGTAPYTYTWTPGGAGSSISVKPVLTTTYNVIAIDSNKCVSNSASVVVTVNPPLTVTVSPNQSMCSGGSMSYTATAGGGDGTYTYSWAPGGYTSSAITVSPAATTVYTITLSDACGTAPVKDSVTATVNPQPVVNFKADTLMGCSKFCVTFTNNSTNDSISTWSYGDGGGSNAINPSKYCYSTAGVFTVSLLVISNKGCIDSLTILNMITVYSHPVAAFTYSPQPVNILNPTVYFKDLSTDNYGPIASWLWTFGDPLDGTSLLQNPNYTYADTGDYCISLIVANKYGCLDSTRSCLDVQPDFTFYIPNAFSPNSDGQNDVFMPYGTYVCGYSMYIFDRWGQQLFYTTDITKGWDGTVGGVKAQEDTYIYLITATDCAQHNQHQYIGRVSLVK